MIAHVPTVIVDVLQQCLGFSPFPTLGSSKPTHRDFQNSSDSLSGKVSGVVGRWTTMQSYSIYIPPRMRNFRLHHQMSKNPSRSTNLKTCRTKGNKIRPEDPSTIVPAGKKKSPTKLLLFPFGKICPLPLPSNPLTELLTSCHWPCCCWLASPQKPPDFHRLVGVGKLQQTPKRRDFCSK